MASTLLLTSIAGSSVAQHASVTSSQSPVAAARRDATLRGAVTLADGGAAIGDARITVFSPGLSFFRETRSDSSGAYRLRGIPVGSYLLGVASLGRAYEERSLVLTRGVNTIDMALVEETAMGSWDVIGDTLPEQLDATDIGVLRPDGTILYCHDTSDSIIFDPRTGAKVFPTNSSSAQGCMNSTLLADGSTLIVGGQAGANPADFVNGIPWVKRFSSGNVWAQLDDMQHTPGRWYPGLARLNDGSVIAIGGGQFPDASRTATCERFDLTTETWSYTGSVGDPVEFPPAALLYTGEVLQTWTTRPQTYDPSTGVWSDTGQLVYPNRGYPGHSDHRLLVLTDGRALILGARRLDQPSATMTEYYDPLTGQWAAGTSPDLVRMQPEAIYLPDGHILVAGGDQETTAGPEPNVLGIVRRCDLLDPLSGEWRRVADLGEFREYHTVSLLLPDGRVTTTGGTRIKFAVGPTSADIEAYSPPYLFRGVRPELDNLSDTSPARGASLTFDVFPDTQLTSVVLMGVQSTTHWLDGGVPRRLELSVQQDGSAASTVLPSDPDLLPLGWYLLFGMVDDIPSEALFILVGA